SCAGRRRGAPRPGARMTGRHRQDPEGASAPGTAEQDGPDTGAGHGPSVVALGGGHGLYATLSALRRFSDDVTAVVTVADDGGSSGRIRSELDIIPPGDLRMALAALAAPDARGGLWTDLLQHRFRGTGALAGHSVGNLVLAGLTELLGDPVAALTELSEVLGVRGA